MRKKVFFIILVITLILVVGGGVFSGGFRQSSTLDYLTKEELFKKLSIEYYGVPDFAKELELVNRSLKIKSPRAITNTDLIIPSYNAIHRLKHKQTTTLLDYKKIDVIEKQHDSEDENQMAENKPEYMKGSFFPFIILMSGIIILFGFIRLISNNYKRRGHLSDKPPEKSVVSDDRILFDFDIDHFEKKMNEL